MSLEVAVEHLEIVEQSQDAFDYTDTAKSCCMTKVSGI